MAEFSPIAENFTPTAPDVSWESDLTTPVPGYVDTDVSESFDSDQSDEPYAFPSVSGAAVSVEESLSKISFVPGTSGQMSSAIAYIRYWSRKGTQQKTAVSDNPVNGAVSDPQDALLRQIDTLSYGTSLNLVPVTQSTPQTGPALTIPTNTAYQSRPRQPVPTLTTISGPSSLNRLGSIFSANPGGATAPAWANPFSSQPAAPSPDNAVWQFLFNPEELQLSSGPDFNRAETWGVSDPANSGQPLSWRSNKNRKLTFGKVLLHGYTFGRRVDSLEKGLQELFLARDGENGADGPPVLEFVWGQRVFGPCVIQNIQVREKAWDKGLLVNAEVSFDLEQVPEWTINDGFVDVLRPGRQSTVNDPTVASEEYRDTATGETGTNTPPPKTSPDTSPQTGLDPTLCNFAVQQSKLFQQFFNRVNTPLTSAAFGGYRSIRRNFFDLKKNLYSGSSEIGKFVDSKLSSGCKNSSFELTVTNLEKSGGNLAISPEQNAVQFMGACSGDTKSRIDEWQRTSPKCKAQRVAGRQARRSKEQEEKLNKQCEKIKLGNSCSGSPNFSERTISTCNRGETVICIRGTWQLKYPNRGDIR